VRRDLTHSSRAFVGDPPCLVWPCCPGPGRSAQTLDLCGADQACIPTPLLFRCHNDEDAAQATPTRLTTDRVLQQDRQPRDLARPTRTLGSHRVVVLNANTGLFNTHNLSSFAPPPTAVRYHSDIHTVSALHCTQETRMLRCGPALGALGKQLLHSLQSSLMRFCAHF
jgi:hypothetical protein